MNQFRLEIIDWDFSSSGENFPLNIETAAVQNYKCFKKKSSLIFFPMLSKKRLGNLAFSGFGQKIVPSEKLNLPKKKNYLQHIYIFLSTGKKRP